MFKFFASKSFLYSILSLILVGFLLYLLVFFVILPTYTRHGDSVLVPDVSNLSETEAIELLKEGDLRYEIRDSVYEPSFSPRSVMEQYPAPLSRVKPDRKVFLTVSKAVAPTVTIPKLPENLRFNVVREMLRTRKLLVGEKITIASTDRFNDEVKELRTNGRVLKAGDLISQGSVVDVVVWESGRKEKVDLPNLVGLSIEDAIASLSELDLNLGTTVYSDEGPLDQDGLVFRQEPAFVVGKQVLVGKSIDLYVYGPDPGE